MVREPTAGEYALFRRAARQEALEDSELDVLFDEFGVSTEAQAAALARSRGWLDADPPVSPAQRTYLKAFDAFLRGEPFAAERREVALRRMFRESGMDDPRADPRRVI